MRLHVGGQALAGLGPVELGSVRRPRADAEFLLELPQIVSGADGETYGSLEEALTAWEAAGRPEHAQPEGHYGPLVRLEEKPSIGPCP